MAEGSAMKRGLLPTECINCTEYNGYAYASLDFESPNATLDDGQKFYKKPPPHWTLSPGDADIVKHVIAKFEWGTPIMLVESGDGFFTNQNKLGGIPGDQACVGCLIKATKDSKVKPKDLFQLSDRVPIALVHCARILIRIPLAAESKDAAASADRLLCRAWKKRRFTDFTLICQGHELPCHRSILAEASEVFEAAISINMQEARERRMVVEDAEPAQVEAMLCYVYTGEVNVAEYTDCLALLKLGDRYAVHGLIKACAPQILDHLSPVNVGAVKRALRQVRGDTQIAKLWEQFQSIVRGNDELFAAMMED